MRVSLLFLMVLCFGLFGKIFRNINKPQLLNSVNGSACVVEVEFSIGKKEVKVVRGIKPNVFEIYVNGKLYNQDANSRDYQKYLEQQILKDELSQFHSSRYSWVINIHPLYAIKGTAPSRGC